MTGNSLLGSILFEPLDDHWAIYLVETRETHVVDALGAHLLRRLVQGMATSDQLAELVIEAGATADMVEASSYVDAALAGWRDAGIVA